MITPNSLQVEEQYHPSTTDDKKIDTSFVLDIDFDIVPYPLSPTEGERQDRAILTKQFWDVWSTSSNYFRPIDDASILSSQMDEDDDLSIASNEFISYSEMDDDDHDLSIASNEFISTDIFSQTMVLQHHSTIADDNGISFVNVIGLEAEDLPDQNSKTENNK
jgi:hypothetical protein